MSTITVLRRTAILAALGSTLIVPAAASADDFQKFTDISYRPQSLIDAIRKDERARPSGISDELDAGNAVERKVSNAGYARYNAYASCRQDGYRRYWCTIGGMRGDCFLNGKASVRKYRGYYRWKYSVSIRSLNKTCF